MKQVDPASQVGSVLSGVYAGGPSAVTAIFVAKEVFEKKNARIAAPPLSLIP